NSLDILPKEIRILQNSSLYHSPNAYGSSKPSADNDAKFINHIARIENLQLQLENNKAKVSAMETALKAITSAQRDMLFSYYINRQRRSVTNLAVDTLTDRSALYRRADRALKKYILAYFGTLGE
ncbi:MAG: hypothetical protein IJW74_04150, partial [Oscillospiraceae bacterium]|nr:hypothetical protein [Oscillospiraceae bacterium]